MTTTTQVTRSNWQQRFQRAVVEPFLIIYHNRRAFIGFLILAFFLIMAVLGPILIPLKMQTDYQNRFQGISLQHPLGTDYQGRDTFQLLVHGSRETLGVAVLTGIFTSLIAVSIGLTAGLIGGSLDQGLMLLTNAVLTVPYLPIQLLLGATFDLQDPFSLAAILSIWAWGGLARGVRSTVLSLKEREFIEAARVLGLSNRHVIFSELMPNVMPFIVIQFLNIVRNAITASVALIYLGLVPLDPKNWGMMLSDATGRSGAVQVSVFNPSALIYVMAPMGAIVLFQLGAVFLAHGLDEVLDPRLRAK
jgi:peptide/nickel transport system permease protein